MQISKAGPDGFPINEGVKFHHEQSTAIETVFHERAHKKHVP
jgi:hypothetical protein